ncbi:hypothetical protein C8R44DRAFT_761407 [Mycena epipterygia]|nr:hypothetical protein C8R44DRAFT_761407 [Mycena epipterygia]
MDAAELESAIADLYNVVITRYVGAAGFMILVYDHLLTLDDEVKYIWSAPSTLAKWLFLILRYMVPIFVSAQMIADSGVAPVTISDTVCKGWIVFQTYAGVLSISISNFLVLMRIWTTLPRGHRIITWSLVLFFIVQLANFIVTTWLTVYNIPLINFQPMAGLCGFTAKPNTVGLWVPGLGFEIIVFVTVCWNALERPRALQSPDADPAVSRLLFRDGVAYFIILFGLRLTNVVFAIVTPTSLVFVAIYFTWSCTTLTTSRLIINSRREASKAAALCELQRSMSLLDETQSTDCTRASQSASSVRRLRSATATLHSG